MFTVDYTIHVSDLVLVGGGIVAFLKAFLWQRDLNKKVLRLLTGEDGRNGLVGMVAKMDHDLYEEGGVVSRIRGSMQLLRVALATRGIHLRDEDQT